MLRVIFNLPAQEVVQFLSDLPTVICITLPLGIGVYTSLARINLPPHCGENPALSPPSRSGGGRRLSGGRGRTALQ